METQNFLTALIKRNRPCYGGFFFVFLLASFFPVAMSSEGTLSFFPMITSSLVLFNKTDMAELVLRVVRLLASGFCYPK